MPHDKARKNNQPKRQRYVAEKRWLKNKARKIERHLKRHPNDDVARKVLNDR